MNRDSRLRPPSGAGLTTPVKSVCIKEISARMRHKMLAADWPVLSPSSSSSHDNCRQWYVIYPGCKCASIGFSLVIYLHTYADISACNVLVHVLRVSAIKRRWLGG
ncbi:hypothetical protein ACSS6W_010766 [Trichoderma asperelloides]